MIQLLLGIGLFFIEFLIVNFVFFFCFGCFLGNNLMFMLISVVFLFLVNILFEMVLFFQYLMYYLYFSVWVMFFVNYFLFRFYFFGLLQFWFGLYQLYFGKMVFVQSERMMFFFMGSELLIGFFLFVGVCYVKVVDIIDNNCFFFRGMFLVNLFRLSEL